MDTDTELDLSADLPRAQRDAALRFSEILSHQELYALMGAPVVNAFRSLSRQVLGRTPRLTKESLAAGLILRHGQDVFADPAIRRKVGRKLGVQVPKRWHAGKGSALHFVREAGFEELFAGTATARSPDDVEWLQGRVEVPSLADFQREVLEGLESNLERSTRDHPRVVLTLPTGAGKTRVAVEYIKDYLLRNGMDAPRAVLWVAHTAELLEQAVESLKQVWADALEVPELRVDRRFGQHGRGADVDEEFLASAGNVCQLVIGTPQRLINDFARWNSGWTEEAQKWRNSIGLVVIDEAHRAAAPQYRTLLDALCVKKQTRVLGLTATPFRQEYMQSCPELGTKELLKLFRRIVEPSMCLGEHPRETLQERSILARPVESRIQTGMRLGFAKLLEHMIDTDEAESLEQIDRYLMDQADEARRRSKVFEQLLPLCSEPANRVLYFGPSVSDAEIVAFMLRAQGVPAGFVSGGSRTSHRRKVIDDFRKGELRVLCNCEVLTTGFDAPQVSHVVIARPTVSHVLFEQMVGRGLRGPKFGGTAECRVIYFVDDMDADHPRLGFRAWREVWGLKKSGRSPET